MLQYSWNSNLYCSVILYVFLLLILMNCCIFLCIMIHIIWYSIWKKWNDEFVLNFRGADHKILQTSVLLQQPCGYHNYHQQHHLCAARHIIIGHSTPKSRYVIQLPGKKEKTFWNFHNVEITFFPVLYVTLWSLHRSNIQVCPIKPQI